MVHLQLSALADFVKAAIYIDKSVINAHYSQRLITFCVYDRRGRSRTSFVAFHSLT